MIMHIDLNSAFATTEQQAHPHLRGKPMGVTNRLSKECCVIAASYEAKALGIKVGTRRTDALALYPKFVMLESDPPKYEAVYLKLIRIMRDYSPKIKMKSIDEGIIDFHGMEPVLNGRTLIDIGREIKQRVRDEIGDWMKINIGIGTNRFLAKEAAGWHKPDGLDVIDHTNLKKYYSEMKLTDLCGIADGYSARLMAYNIMTPMQFFNASEFTLKKQVFKSINGVYWHRRLHGWEIDDFDTELGTVGRQWVVHKPTHKDSYLLPCLSMLCETTGAKLRYRRASARGITVWAVFQTGETWGNKRMYKVPFYSNMEIVRRAFELFRQRPSGMIVTMIGISCYGIEPSTDSQLSMFEDVEKEKWITKAMDDANDRYGLFTVMLASSLDGKGIVKQKVPFGGTEYFDLLLKRA